MKKGNTVRIEALNNLNEFYAEVTSQLNIVFIHWEKLDEIINSSIANNNGNMKISNNGNNNNITNLQSKVSVNMTNFNLKEKTLEFHNYLINIKNSFQQHYIKMNECFKSMVRRIIIFY